MNGLGPWWFDTLQIVLGLLALGGLGLALKWAFLPGQSGSGNSPRTLMDRLGPIESISEGYLPVTGKAPPEVRLGNGGPARKEDLPKGDPLQGECTCMFCRMVGLTVPGQSLAYAYSVLRDEA